MRHPPQGPGHCRLCYWYHHDAAFRARVDGGEAGPARPAREIVLPSARGKCRHLGRLLSLTDAAGVLCSNCTGRRLHACDLARDGRPVYGACRPRDDRDLVMCCAVCPDHTGRV